MKAVVMAGGEGARLRPMTSRRPKPLVPVAGTPVIEHTLALLREHGIREVVVTLQYLGAEIRNRLGDGSEYDMAIEYVVEESPLGTAGSVRNAAHLLDDTFLVISGDALTDIDLSWALDEHRSRHAQATVILKAVSNPLEYGVVVTDADGAVRRFLEKPSWGEVFSDHANTGMYVVEPEILQRIKPGRVADWSRDVFPGMLRRGERLHGVLADGYWLDIGSTMSYLQANWDALEGRVRCRIGGRRQGEAWIGDGVEFGMGARVEGPVFLGDEVKIKAGAFINGPAVIDRFSVVDDNAKLSNSIVWPGSYIGENCRLRQTVICRNVTVKNNCLIEDETVVGDDCIIGRGARVNAGVKIWPHKEIQPGSSVRESVIWAGEWRRGLFASYGMGGLVNVELTPEFCARLGAAFGASLPKGAAITVTRDHARSSRMIKQALIAGIVSAGATVRDLGALPVPVSQDAIARSTCLGGVHVLSSPLDQRSADVRFFDAEGLALDRRSERRLENLFFREDFRRASFYEMGEIEYASPLADYVARLLSGIDVDLVREASLRLLVDYDFGAASLVLPEVLNTLEVTTVSLHAGFGEEHRPHASMDEAARITRTVGADLGYVVSATAERFRLIDGAGTPLNEQQAIAVVASMLLATGAAEVVLPVATPQWVLDTVRRQGGMATVARNDAGSVLRQAMEHSAVMAADGAGGIAWPRQLGAYDAMYTLVKLLELQARLRRPIADLRSHLVVTPHLTASAFCPWELKGRVLRELVQAHDPGDMDLVDGVKITVPGGYVLVVPDRDAPSYQLAVSHTDVAAAAAILEEYRLRVQAVAGAGAEDEAGATTQP
ncbi:MAG: sugar phosphate nucleotidyltransferase [Candidatus Dormibacteria bacterium]